MHGWEPAPGCTIVDTLIVARLIFPHVAELDDRVSAVTKQTLGKLRGRQSLEAWGMRLGTAKTGTDIEDWSEWSPEMQKRCVGDVAICKALRHLLQPDGYSQHAIELEHRAAAICERISADGAPFDTAAAERLDAQWRAQHIALGTKLAEQFPGTNFNSRQQLAALFEARGWCPEKRTEKTGQPKIDDEVLETIPEQYPEFAGLAEYLLLGRRLAQLATGDEAWLKHVDAGGHIHGGIVHIGTPHSRAKHLAPNLAQVPNPKKGKPFGAECRALFRPGNGWLSVAADQASLQDRGLAHYLSPYDGGAYAKAFTEGADTHWRSAIALGLVPEGAERDKESKVHTAIREGAKRFRYAFLYGVQAATAGRIIFDTTRNVKLLDDTSGLHRQLFVSGAHPSASTLRQAGTKALKRFVEGTPGLGCLQEKLQGHVSKHSWLPGLDGRRVPVRAQYTSLNYIVTSSEAIICKRWLVQVYDELCTRFRYGWDGDVVIALWVHDELVCCCRPKIAEQVGEIMVRHAREAGAFYNFRIPLDADFKIARSWADESGESVSADTDRPKPSEPQPNPAPRDVTQPVAKPATKPVTKQPEANAAQPQICIQCQGEIADGAERYAYNGGWLHSHCERPFIRARMAATAPPPRSNGGNGRNTNAGAKPAGNGRAHHRSDYNHATDPDGAPYAPIRDKLTRRGYRLARSFDFTLPGGAAVLFSEDRFELAPHITPCKGRERKTYRFRHNVNGSTYNGTGPRRIVYNWPAVMDTGPGSIVFVVEGANKADPLIAAGLVATAAPHHTWNGEGNECTEALAGRHIIYLEDHDLPDAEGQCAAKKHSAKAQAALAPRAASFRIVPALVLWQNLGRAGEPPHGWDVKDFIEAGGDAAKLHDIYKQVAPACQLESVNAAQVKMKAYDWLWPDRFALGEIGLIVGMPDEGKGQILAHIAARVTRRLAWPNSEGQAPQGRVIMLTAEDSSRPWSRV